MHGGHLVKELWLDQLHAWLKEFRADNHRKCTAHDEHGETEPQVQRTNIFMVGSENPTTNIF